MSPRTKVNEIPVPRLVQHDGLSSFSLIYSDAPVVRTTLNRSKNALLHLAADGSLVRMDVNDDSPPRTEPYRDSELFMAMSSAAEVIGVHTATARRMAARGDLRALRIGNEWITTVAWVEEFRKNRRRPGRPRKSA